MGTLNTGNINLTGNVSEPNKPAFSVYRSGANQNISHNTYTKVLFDTEVFDVGSNFDTSNSRFTAPITGKYLLMGHIYIYPTYQVENHVYKNGSHYKRFSGPIGSGGNDNPNGQKFVDVVHLDVGEYVEIYARQFRTGDSNAATIYGGNEKETSFVGYLI